MKTLFLLSCLPVVAFLTGCGGVERPKTQPVTGKITLEGKPLTDADIVFHPTGDDGVIARGKTDEDGNYKLTTYDTGDGAVEGEYKITISKVDKSATVAAKEVDLDNPGEMYSSMMTEGNTETDLKDQVPTDYASPETTPESRTVKTGDNSFNFEIAKK